MAIAALYEDSASISTSEYSLVSDSTSLANDTTDGVFQIFLDLSALTITEEYELKVYEKVQSAGTKRTLLVANYFGPIVPAHVVLPSLVLMHGWDVTGKITGTARTVGWSIRQVA